MDGTGVARCPAQYRRSAQSTGLRCELHLPVRRSCHLPAKGQECRGLVGRLFAARRRRANRGPAIDRPERRRSLRKINRVRSVAASCRRRCIGNVHRPASLSRRRACTRKRKWGLHRQRWEFPASGRGSSGSRRCGSQTGGQSLPEGKASKPIAGYVCFPILKMNKNTHLQLKYEVNGTAAVLPFPEK
jgi:hypothetical protein